MSNKNIEFINKWFQEFAPDISRRQKEKCYIGTSNGYLWHACSYELIEHFEGNEARDLYNVMSKNGATEFKYDAQCRIGLKGMPTSLQKRHLTAEQIDELNLIEFFVFGKDYSWCYIRTHESDWGLGPYFIYNSNRDKNN